MARIKTQEQGRELVQATLGENISIIWDIDPHSPPVCPQNVIDLKQQLLCFSSLVPIEMEHLFSEQLHKDPKPMNELAIDSKRNFKSKIKRARVALDIASSALSLKESKAGESRWVKSVAEKFIFKGLDYSIDNSQDYLGIFDQLEMVNGVQFQKKCRTLFSGLFLGKRWSPKIGTTLPKPDLLFGLPTLHKQELKLFHAHHTLKHFEREHMKKLGTTSPIRVNYNLCFPWGVYEAKKVENSTTKAALFVYVQIARASAVCAALLEELSTPENRLPIISFTSIGAKWEVFLCYESITQPQKYHVLRIWKGDVTNCWDALKLLHIVEYARAWVLRTFKPWIADCLCNKHCKSEICNTNLGGKERQINQAERPSTPVTPTRVRPQPSSRPSRTPTMGDFPPSPPLTDPRRATTTRHAGKGDSRSWSPSRSPVPVNLPPSPPLTNPRHAVTIASTVSDASLFEGGDYFCSTNNAAPIFHGQRIGAAAIPWQSSSGEPESCDSNLSAGSSSESSYPESSSDENTDIYDSDQPDGEPADTESEAGELSVEKPCENERTKASKPQLTTRQLGSSSFLSRALGTVKNFSLNPSSHNVAPTSDVPIGGRHAVNSRPSVDLSDIRYTLRRMSGLGSRSNTLEFDKPSISRRSSIFGLVSRTNSGLDSDKMSHKDPPGSFPRDSTNHRNPENPGAQKAMKGKKNKKKGIPEGHVA